MSLYWGEVTKSSYLGGVDSYLGGVFLFGDALILGGVFCTSGPPYNRGYLHRHHHNAEQTAVQATP